MNILLINHYAGSPFYGMEFRPYYMAREWVSAGHQVQIVAASYSHIRARQPKLYGVHANEEQIDGINYRWYPTPAYSSNGFGRVKNMLSFMLQLWRDANQLVREFKPDVVIASSTYPMDIWPAQKIARLAEAKLFYEVHDLWPLSPIELGGMSRWHPFIIWAQLAENYAYKHVDRVVSMLPKTLNYMMSHGLVPEKWSYVPNGVDLSEWENPADLPLDVQSTIDDLKMSGLPIVAYTGTHGLANALDALLDAAAHLKGIAHVLLVGTGPERERLLRRVANEALVNVTMLPSVPKAAMPKLLSQIDIAYIGWHPNPLYKFGISPNKLMDYMMAGKPIVHSVSAGNDPVMEVGCGLTVAPRDVDSITYAIKCLSALSEQESANMGALGREYIMEHRLYPTLAKEFLDIMIDTVSGKRAARSEP